MDHTDVRAHVEPDAPTSLRREAVDGRTATTRPGPSRYAEPRVRRASPSRRKVVQPSIDTAPSER